MISITIQSVHPIPLVITAGRIDSSTSAELDQALRPLIERQKYLVLDLLQCNYLSSAGIRVLLVAAKKLISAGGGLYLSGLSAEIYQVIEMAGLHNIFHLTENIDAAQEEIERIRIRERGSTEWSDGTCSFQFHRIEHKKQPALRWKDEGIAGFDELNITIGTGSPTDMPGEGEPVPGIFITNGRCAGFIPDGDQDPPEFIIPQNPARAGVRVRQAISFGREPAGLVRLSEPSSILPAQLADGLYRMKNHLYPGKNNLTAVVIADFNPEAPSIFFCLLVDREMREAFKLADLGELEGLIPAEYHHTGLVGARFLLDQVPQPPQDISVENFLGNTLTFENILNVGYINPGGRLVNPVTWMFISDGSAGAANRRLHVETDGNFSLEPHQEFLTRRLYADSSRLVIKQLHGGYSAQTYQVTSFDHDGRKLRPTVMKIANRAIISRESDRCRQFALPYILNNSAQVLGTEFYGDTGALRYNFVGIGGEQSQLKWLAGYFVSWPPEKLEPLFDKIFLQILNPWYGQPRAETIFPFRDHDPTLTFFPTICETAAELFSLSLDDPYFKVTETGQTLVNPYWFLKHEFAGRRKTGIEYSTSICHGDLNMQNILLDEDMNVYLIDFSETRPRSVISDFARLEAIFIVEHAPVDSVQDMEDYIRFLYDCYGGSGLGDYPVNTYKGAHPEVVGRILALTVKMREYAFRSSGENPDAVPYWMAMLEWTLPIVCYYGTSDARKRLSMIVAGLLSRNVMTALGIA